ncbi:MAG: MFS transporter [Candidatus Omnitrophota bacterium]
MNHSLMAGNSPADSSIRRRALGFIVLFGLVSLFGDLVYEGARSVNGSYLKLFAVDAVTLGLVTGAGEFLGYALRLVSGYLSDKTKSYWLLTIIGYGLLVSVPLLSLAGIWQIAALLIITERIGKAIRSPARDVILSQASSRVGTGFGFGLHEAMDQIGAVVGPLIFTVYFTLVGKGQIGIAAYQLGYAFLWIPFLLVMFCLFIAYRRIPHPAVLEIGQERVKAADKLSKLFWLYTLFTFAATLGFCSFVLLAFHFKSANILSDAQIPLYYAIAMGIDAVAALSIGKLYDVIKKRKNNHNAGLNLLVIIPCVTLLMPLFIFSQHRIVIVFGVLCWGIVMGIHETIMRSAISDITSLNKRGAGYGIFNATYGLAFFLGSVLLGFLYDRSITFVIVAIILIECAALVIFFYMKREGMKD